MTGSSTYRSLSKLLAVCMAATAILAVISPSAQAHTKNNFHKERKHIKRRAKSELGAPYSYGGTSPSGFDCSGFTMWTYDGHGEKLPHSSMDQFDLGKRDGYERIWKRKNLRIGDLVFQKTTSARVGHAGIYVGHGNMISSTTSGGVSKIDLYDPYYWGDRWVGATRLPVTQAH